MAGQLPQVLQTIDKTARKAAKAREIFGTKSIAYYDLCKELRYQSFRFKQISQNSIIDHCMEFPDTNPEDLDAKTLIEMGY